MYGWYLCMKIKGAIRWNLKAIMDQCQIGTMELSTFMKVAPRTVTKWRQAKYLPEINEKRCIQICIAINELCDINGIPDCKIAIKDLIQFSEHELRDFDVPEYQYPSGDARKSKKQRQKAKENDTDDGTDTTIAA
jgi:hypothetical protein